MSRVCIIPARGGSKRIPRKNIRPFRGRPILHWSVAAARASGLFDLVMVSTDDAEIAQVARQGGAEVPFLRDPATADDHATTEAVLTEVLARLAAGGRRFETALCLYPTAPFATPADLHRGLSLLEGEGFDMVMPVCAFDSPIWRALLRGPDGTLTFAFPEHLDTRTQDLPGAFHDAGQWYWLRCAPFAATGNLMPARTGSIVLPAERVQDIDTPDDWTRAEAKHGALFPDA